MPGLVNVIAHSHVDRKVGGQLDVVLNEPCNVVRLPARIYVRDRLLAVADLTQQEARNRVTGRATAVADSSRLITVELQEVRVEQVRRVPLVPVIDTQTYAVPALGPGHDIGDPNAVIDIDAVLLLAET